MSYRGTTSTKFGRFAIQEPFRPESVVVYRGEPLTTVDHEPPIPVLDQEDLLAQGIHASTFIPGANDVDALGSCTCNAGTASLAERTLRAKGAIPAALSSSDSAANEVFAIKLYHSVTDQTHETSEEWPPTDCGSTGLYVCEELITQGLATSYLSATDIHGLVALLQGGTVIMGCTWFNSFMDPDSNAFVDSDGSTAAFAAAVASGVAGGHETCISAVEKLTFDAAGNIDAPNSIVRVRNSWSANWGDHGSYRLHLSTIAAMLGGYNSPEQADLKQFVI